MTRNQYNGWYNYETWNVALWLDNDEGPQTYWQEQAAHALEQAQADAHFTKQERATIDLADQLKESFEDQEADLLETAKATASVWADLLNAALSEVNWHEIASHYIEAAMELETN